MGHTAIPIYTKRITVPHHPRSRGLGHVRVGQPRDVAAQGVLEFSIEAIEILFSPVATFGGAKGSDGGVSKTLKSRLEPKWQSQNGYGLIVMMITMLIYYSDDDHYVDDL